ncbi:hypothetical protein BCR35DRAFT_290647 [Leucosporidium creatinivorum]|uniref:NADH dehydrogenase [ubiquinone] iron-sulfur protein 5 n=1 Tax=Leucosporidium creatinivorum TaxID=106004 RepID=A0A1Y2FG45_9BASI|nr:hypothetical protein BCR35DRAFT_290647 [Leucosporidium creatinivorum]
MASGFGYTGGRSRCFPYWQDFQKCYASADTPSQCTLPKEDYLECLHHTKEVSRALTIKSQYLTKTAHELEAKRKEAEVAVESGIMGLGLLTKEA